MTSWSHEELAAKLAENPALGVDMAAAGVSPSLAQSPRGKDRLYPTVGELKKGKQVSVVKERESDLAIWVEGLFLQFGWNFYHTYEQLYYARRSTKGFPDYVAISPILGQYDGEDLRRMLVVELKSETGRVTPEQRMWLDLFTGVTAEVYLVRPSDRDEFAEMIVLGHTPNSIELAECRCSWQNRRIEQG